MTAENLLPTLQKCLAAISSIQGNLRIGIIGWSREAIALVGELVQAGFRSERLSIYVPDGAAPSDHLVVDVLPLSALSEVAPQIVVIASDDEKEELLEAAVPYLRPTTRVVLYGYQHFRFRDELFDEVTANPLVPSLANGYPNTLIHIYQCLRNAARSGCQGVVAEFGMFKGGTTMLISRFIERLGANWKVYGFDTFDGFPAKRSVLDMYEHEGCVFRDEAGVRSYLAGRNVEIVAGDIVATAKRLSGMNIVLAFIDTDNYTSANAVLDVIQETVVVGGAIVFDHFTGRDRFLYTLGERMAGKRLLDDARYFNLHDTGVFIRTR